jgi:hypothetical protein
LSSIIRRVLVLGLMLLVALALAAPALAQGAGEAHVRVAHLSPDAPNVYVNGEPALTDVPYTTVSSYLPLPAGTQQVTVYPAGDTTTPVIDAPLELAAGGAYTLNVNAGGTNQTVLTVPDTILAEGGVYSAFAVGTVFADSLDVLLVQDNAGGAATASASASAPGHRWRQLARRARRPRSDGLRARGAGPGAAPRERSQHRDAASSVESGAHDGP